MHRGGDSAGLALSSMAMAILQDVQDARYEGFAIDVPQRSSTLTPGANVCSRALEYVFETRSLRASYHLFDPRVT